ncbi:Ribosome-Hypothetical protein factor A [Nesidiocoris tenuis]|uniref:Ribosome-binding factor A n=1 Tax=Nesidiocoris tenuis TaxID=355587 RepID=A0ABN7AAU7_9HEMI|nr:Ribosome-Hypothetical protein factor A [Nesidiocoris tenuis]
MNRNKTKEKFYLPTESVTKSPIDQSKPRPVNSRRIAVLNKLFMTNITEVLATGTLSETVESLHIDISKVAMSPDFQHLNVFYVCTVTPRPPDLDEQLTRTGFSLRHELSQQRLMGNVPLINFVEDKTLARLTEIQAVLAVADKGTEDTAEADRLGSLEDPDTDSRYEESMKELNVPQQVYGLNRSKIYDKIMAAKKASLPRKRNADTINIPEGVAFTPYEQQKLETSSNKREPLPRHIIKAYFKESKTKSS